MEIFCNIINVLLSLFINLMQNKSIKYKGITGPKLDLKLLNSNVYIRSF